MIIYLDNKKDRLTWSIQSIAFIVISSLFCWKRSINIRFASDSYSDASLQLEWQNFALHAISVQNFLSP